MRVLVTGSAGHLGEALVRTLRRDGHEVVGLDLLGSPFTDQVGSIGDADFVTRCMRGVDVVLHSATLHKPHVATHDRSRFVATNVQGTLNLLEAALASGVSSFVFTSTTSVFGSALTPADGEPAAWVTESLRGVPKNIYGVTKSAAEDLCELFYRSRGLPCVVLRTSRFFPEADDDPQKRAGLDDGNLKANEYLHRRVELEDAVQAHLLAAEHAPRIGFARYIVSATTPFDEGQLARLRGEAAAVVREIFPDCEAIYAARDWKLPTSIDRVYVNRRARQDLGWTPRFDFRHLLDRLRDGEAPASELATLVGSKGYHSEHFEDGPYPVEPELT